MTSIGVFFLSLIQAIRSTCVFGVLMLCNKLYYGGLHIWGAAIEFNTKLLILSNCCLSK